MSKEVMPKDSCYARNTESGDVKAYNFGLGLLKF